MANQNITKNMCEDNPIFKYLCPSLLSKKNILEELQARCFKIKGLERKSKEELTEIFIRHLMPLPQRTFPNNHHGKLINNMIQKESYLARRSGRIEERKTTLQYGFTDKKQDSKSSSIGAQISTSSSTDRLKPPIDSSHPQTRKISLSKSASSSSKSSLDKVVIKDRSKERKNSSESDDQRSTNEDSGTESKKVELKRSHSTESNEDSSPSKKARQRIAWP